MKVSPIEAIGHRLPLSRLWSKAKHDVFESLVLFVGVAMNGVGLDPVAPDCFNGDRGKKRASSVSSAQPSCAQFVNCGGGR